MKGWTCGFCGKEIHDGQMAEIELGKYRISPGQTTFNPQTTVAYLHDYCLSEVEARVCGHWYPKDYLESKGRPDK